MISIQPVQLLGTATEARIGLPASATRLLQVASVNRWSAVGNVDNRWIDSIVFRHKQDGAGEFLLQVDRRGAWQTTGDVEVLRDPEKDFAHVDIDHPVVFSSCDGHNPVQPAQTLANIEAAGSATFSVVGSPLASGVSVYFAADRGLLVAKPQLRADNTIVAEIYADGHWRIRREWDVLSIVHCPWLKGFDFAGGTPDDQTIGFVGSDLAYRTAAGSTVTLSP